MIIVIIKLLIAAVLPIALAVLLYRLERKTAFGKWNYWLKQLVFGLVFSAASIFANDFGAQVDEAVLTMRNVAPIVAGLIFGGPAGIFVGVVGGIECWLSQSWQGGSFTALAASLSVFVAGGSAAIVRQFMLDNKKPTYGLGFAVGVTTEVLHMLLIFITNMDMPLEAFGFVKALSNYLVPLNAFSVMLAVLFVSLMGKDKTKKEKIDRNHHQLTHIFTFFLLVCVVIAFLSSCLFTHSMQNRLAEATTDYVLKLNIKDVEEAIAENNSVTAAVAAAHNRHIGQTGCVIICDSNRVIISDRDGHEGMKFWESGIVVSNYSTIEENTLFIATVYGEPSYCVYTQSGEYFLFSVLPMSEANFSRDFSVYLTIFMEIIVFAALFMNVYFLVKYLVVENIHKVNQSLSKITGGNLDETVNVSGNEEFASLSNDINSTVDTLKRYIAEAETRIDAELEFARQIQHAALPSVFPPYPNRKDFDIYAYMNTAKEVGGDFYDFYLYNQNTLIFLVADVSGKGIPAAMFMMTAKALIKSYAESGDELNEVLAKVNNKLCENNEAQMFVTCWIGALDLRNGNLSYANAGHNPPLIRRKGGEFEYLRSRPNLVLAGMDGIKYRLNEARLLPGDQIYLYTDGVTEATNAEKQLYGEERLKKTLSALETNDPKAFCEAVQKDIDLFVGDAEQFDDITMLAVNVNFLQGNDQLITNPSMEELKAVSAFIERKVKEWNLDRKINHKLQIAVDEIYSNVLSYSGASIVKVICRKEEGAIALVFIDNGKPYDPTQREAPDITLSIDERPIGGLGIFMVRKFASSFEYERTDDLNTLTVKFAVAEEDTPIV